MHFTADTNDVRSVSTPGALRVVGVNGPALERLDCLLAAGRLVQCVRVDHDLQRKSCDVDHDGWHASSRK